MFEESVAGESGDGEVDGGAADAEGAGEIDLADGGSGGQGAREEAIEDGLVGLVHQEGPGQGFGQVTSSTQYSACRILHGFRGVQFSRPSGGGRPLGKT
jgi:hypothetical protein